nr:hypothetical protein [Tanacetum cinerariifolium]
MTIGLDLPKQILKAHTKARKPENIEAKDVGGMLTENLRESNNLMKKKSEPRADGMMCLNNKRGTCLLTPVPESWLSSPFHLLSTSHVANALASPWSISALSWASVTGVVVVVVVVAGVDLVGSGDDHGESSDGGGVSITRSMATSVSERSDMGVWARIDILAVTQCTGGGTESAGVRFSSSSFSSSSSSSLSASSLEDTSSSSSSLSMGLSAGSSSRSRHHPCRWDYQLDPPQDLVIILRIL